MDLTLNQKRRLEEWTGLKCSHIIFDTETDNWNDSEIFNGKLIGKNHLLFVIQTEDGEKFGYYLNPTITYVQFPNYNWSDEKSFEFTLESKERGNQPIKFEIKNKMKNGYTLFDNHSNWNMNLISFGEIFLAKEKFKEHSNCEQHDDMFDYHGIQNALCGKQPNERGEMYFTPKRIVIIQMN